jgi:ABC-2 type transport system ATP-binding protein
MIAVKNLTKKYGKIEALKDISFEVQKGEILGFLGPNGAGKTTTMKIITGFFPPSSGSVQIGCLSIEKHVLECKKKIGYLPENVPLYHDLRVNEFFQFVARIKGVSTKEYKRQIGAIISECSLEPVAHRIIGTLSKGYKQRVGLAQALIGDPEILILDEPTIGLDPKQIIEIRSLIKNMSGRRTVILCTHVLPEVSMVSDRVVIINEGHIVAIDTPQNLDKRLRKSHQIAITAIGEEAQVIAVLSRLAHVASVSVYKRNPDNCEYLVETDVESDIRHEIACALISERKNIKLLEIRSVALSLEDIFLKLVRTEEGVD